MNKIVKFKPIGNPERDWRQKEFMITSFSIGKDARKPLTYKQVEKFIDVLIDLGFNQTEMGWADHDTTVKYAPEICEKKNFNLILQDVAVFGKAGLNMTSSNATEEVIEDVVKEYSKFNCIKGYYVWDEAYKPEQIEQAAELTEYFYKYAPDKFNLAIMLPSSCFNRPNDCPIWANDTYAAYAYNFAETIKPPVISVDYYPFGVAPHKDDDAQLDVSEVWLDLGIIRQVGLEKNIPAWFYYQATRVAPNFPRFEAAMIRVQINYALMYGIKGLQCYGLSGTTASDVNWNDIYMVVDHQFNKGHYYYDFKRYINAAKNWGKTFIALTSKHIYHDDKVLEGRSDYDKYFRENIKDEKLFKMDALEHRCSVGTFTDPEGNDYFCVLNRDYRNQNTFTLDFSDNVRLYEVSATDGKQFISHENTNSLTVTLDAGDMRLYRVQKADEEAYTIEYICEE